MMRRLFRTLMAGYFVANGADLLREPTPLDQDGGVASMPGMTEEDTALLMRGTGAAQVTGGVLLALDIAPRAAAAGLAASMVPTTMVDAQASDPEWTTTLSGVLRDLALLGGLAITAMDTEGRPGMGWRALALADRAAKTAEWRRREAELLGQIARQRAQLKAAEARAKTVVPVQQATRDARLAIRIMRGAGHVAGRAAGLGRKAVSAALPVG